MQSDFNPPETLAENLRKQMTRELGKYSHVANVDRDLTIPAEFYSLPEKFNADIISVQVEPSSAVFRVWEKATF